MAARFGVTAALFSLLLLAVAPAQEYQRLHVRAFTLRSDAARPQLEQPFHVTLLIRVSEDVQDVRNVFLPTFNGAEELGDQREVTHGHGGTIYRETLTLVAHTRGTLSISSAYLDAIDARDGKPKRFISNSLQLAVGGGPVNEVWGVLRAAAFVVMNLVFVAAAIFVAVVIFGRRRLLRQAPEPAQLNASVSNDPLAGAFEDLRLRRDRHSVMQLRAALWERAGGGPGETLGDVLRRPAAGREDVRSLLMIVERAAFIEESRLDEAIEEVLCSPR